jgi:uncharacterized protein (TIGR02145 family)
MKYITVFILLLVVNQYSILFSQYYNQIGSQKWMTKNLDVYKFQNGDEIVQSQTEDEWIENTINKVPTWCYPDFGWFSSHGKIYNWYAVIDRRKLAPNGYRIPNKNDWETLNNYLEGYLDPSTIFKKNFSNKEAGGGYLEIGKGMVGFSSNRMKAKDSFWTKTQSSELNAYAILFHWKQEILEIIEPSIGHGFYVRCISN